MMAGDADKETFARIFAEYSKYYGVNILEEYKEFAVTGHVPGLLAPIVGRIDLIYTIHDTRNGFNEKRVLAIEFKSTSRRATQTLIGYHNSKGEWVPGTLAEHPQYLAQVWAYMKFCPLTIDEWLLIAWDRPDRVYSVYALREEDGFLWWSPVSRVHPTTEDPIRGKWQRAPFTWESIIERLQILERHIALREPPPRYDPVMGVKYCAHVVNGEFTDPPRKPERDEVWWKCYSKGKHYCQYASLCWGLVSWEEAQAQEAQAEDVVDIGEEDW